MENESPSDAPQTDSVQNQPEQETVPQDVVQPETAQQDSAPEPNAPPPSQSLAEAAARLEIELPADQLKKLEGYCKILWAWNEKMNLTRHTDWDRFAQRDLLDSWKIASLLEPEEDLLDVGTGGGVPGIPLAILRPDISVSVCDSVGKKAKAVQDMVKRLGLHVAVYDSRVQKVLEDLRFHSLVTRGVGSLKKQLEWVQPHWLSFDRLLAIKGPRWIDERGEARHHGLMNEIDLRRLTAYIMPGTESESVILQLKRVRGE